MTRPGPAYLVDIPTDYVTPLFERAGHTNFRLTIGLKDGRVYAVSDSDARTYRLTVNEVRGGGVPSWHEVPNI